MGQTKIQSLIEASLNVIIGYWVGITAQMFIFPLFGMYIALHSHLLIGLMFTVVSLGRSYLLRRMFNKLHREKII